MRSLVRNSEIQMYGAPPLPGCQVKTLSFRRSWVHPPQLVTEPCHQIGTI